MSAHCISKRIALPDMHANFARLEECKEFASTLRSRLGVRQIVAATCARKEQGAALGQFHR